MRVITSASQQVLPGYTKEGEPRYIRFRDDPIRPPDDDQPIRRSLPRKGEIRVSEIEDTTNLPSDSFTVAELGREVPLPGGRAYFPDERLIKVMDVYRRFTFLENTIFRMLVEQEGKVVAKRTLTHRLWGSSDPALSRSLNNYISNIRKKLRSDDEEPRKKSIVRSIPRKGYCLDIFDVPNHEEDSSKSE